MNLLKKQIAARLKVEELTNALKEIIKVKGQGCNAKSGRDDIHWLAITNFTIIVAHIFTVSNSLFFFAINAACKKTTQSRCRFTEYVTAFKLVIVILPEFSPLHFL